MSTMTAQEAAAAIQAYMAKCGGLYRDWYCGVAANPSQRLFVEHKVRQNGAWIHRPCASDGAARAVEAYFLNRGCQGGQGGGGRETCHVYAYLITPDTVETAVPWAESHRAGGSAHVPRFPGRQRAA